jgi:hypothetical protein
LTVSNPYTQKPTLQTSTPQTSGKATAALVLGLLSLIFNCFTALPAMIVGVMAVGEINRSQGRLTGKGMAFAGIIVSAISMLATVGIVILIAVVLGPAFGEARTAAQIVHESNNMKQVGLAMHNYHAVHKSFPSVGTKEVPLSWRVSILPFLEGNALHDQFDFSQPADSAHNAAVGSQMPEVYGTELFAHGPNQSPLQIPFVAGAAELPPVPQSQVSIQASMGAPGKGVRSAAFRDIIDGSSNTVMAVLARPETLRGTWIQTDSDYPFDPANPAAGLFQTSGGQYLLLFVDGSVQRVSADIDPETLKNLMLRDDLNAVNF